MWDVNPPTSSSWTWRKLLKIRTLFCPLIKYSIEDGFNTSLWFHSWLPLDAIQVAMSDRVIYDSALPRNAKVKDIIRGNSWHWPIANSLELLSLKEATQHLDPPATHRRDQILWTPIASGSFSTSSAWNQLRERRSKVP